MKKASSTLRVELSTQGKLGLASRVDNAKLVHRAFKTHRSRCSPKSDSRFIPPSQKPSLLPGSQIDLQVSRIIALSRYLRCGGRSLVLALIAGFAMASKTSNKDEKMSLTRIFCGVLGVLFASVAAVFPMWFVPAYRTVHESLSTALPALTAFYLYYSMSLWLLPVAVAVIWFKWPKTRLGEGIACLAGFVGMLVSVLLCVVAMYLPAFEAA